MQRLIKNNIFERLEKFLKENGYSRLINPFSASPISVLIFVLRSSVGEFPENYWTAVIENRFREFRDEIEKLICKAKKKQEIQKLLAEILAGFIANWITSVTKELPFSLPKSGVVLDIGSGYLTGLSGILVRSIMNRGKISLILLDRGVGPALIIPRVLSLLGSPKNIIFMKGDILSLTGIHDVDLVTLIFTLHEITNTLFNIELLRACGKAKMSRMILLKELPTIKKVIEKIYGVLRKGGKIVVIDKEIDDFDIGFIEGLLDNFFRIIKSNYINESNLIIEAVKY